MKKMSWLIKASILGFAFFISVLLIKPIGVSTQFSVLSGIVHNALDQDVIIEDDTRESGYRSTNAYYDKDEGKLAKSIMNPLNYDFIFVLGIPLGAIIGHLITKRVKTRKESRENIIDRKKESRVAMDSVNTIEPLHNSEKGFIRTYLPSFLAGTLILYGARMADGCTSGHMMSGIMQSSVSGFLFMISVFIIAIPTSILKTKLSLKRGN